VASKDAFDVILLGARECVPRDYLCRRVCALSCGLVERGVKCLSAVAAFLAGWRLRGTDRCNERSAGAMVERVAAYRLAQILTPRPRLVLAARSRGGCGSRHHDPSATSVGADFDDHARVGERADRGVDCISERTPSHTQRRSFARTRPAGPDTRSIAADEQFDAVVD